MPRISPNKLRPLSERDAKFLELITSPAYSRDNDGLRRAYVDAGWSDGKGAMSNARSKLRDLNEHIQLRIHEKIGSHVPWALNELVELAKNTKNDLVKMKVLLEIMNRAGYTTPITIEHIKDDPRDMTAEQIRKEILQILKQRSKPELKVVGGQDKDV